MKKIVKIAIYVFVALFICMLLYSAAGIVYSLLDREYISAIFYSVRAIEHLTSLTLAACAYLLGRDKL